MKTFINFNTITKFLMIVMTVSVLSTIVIDGMGINRCYAGFWDDEESAPDPGAIQNNANVLSPTFDELLLDNLRNPNGDKSSTPWLGYTYKGISSIDDSHADTFILDDGRVLHTNFRAPIDGVTTVKGFPTPITGFPTSSLPADYKSKGGWVYDPNQDKWSYVSNVFQKTDGIINKGVIPTADGTVWLGGFEYNSKFFTTRYEPSESAPAPEVPSNTTPTPDMPNDFTPVPEVPSNTTPTPEVPSDSAPTPEVPSNNTPAPEVPSDTPSTSGTLNNTSSTVQSITNCTQAGKLLVGGLTPPAGATYVFTPDEPIAKGERKTCTIILKGASPHDQSATFLVTGTGEL